jgi:hypothetical protein
MPAWALPVFVFLVWCLWAMAAAAQRGAADARRGIPAEQWGGVSIFPAIPVFPLAFWGIAWLIDHAASPWGTILVGGPHVVFAVCLAVSLVRDVRYLRSLGR